MRKPFVVPVLRQESRLAELTLGVEVCSNCDSNIS